MLADAFQLKYNLWCQRLISIFYFDSGIDGIKFFICKCIFTKEPNKTSKRLFRSLPKIVHLLEGCPVCSSPPNMGLTGKFCVCVGQNIAKQHIF